MFVVATPKSNSNPLKHLIFLLHYSSALACFALDAPSIKNDFSPFPRELFDALEPRSKRDSRKWKVYQNVNLIPPSDRIRHDYVQPSPDVFNHSRSLSLLRISFRSKGIYLFSLCLVIKKLSLEASLFIKDVPSPLDSPLLCIIASPAPCF